MDILVYPRFEFRSMFFERRVNRERFISGIRITSVNIV